MNIYPSINNYTESILSPEGRFRTLGQFKLVKKKGGTAFHESDHHRISFLLDFEGRLKVLTCKLNGDPLNTPAGNRLSKYFRDLGSPYVGGFEILPKEIFVFKDNGEGDYYDVILEDYHEGTKLNKLLNTLAARVNRDGVKQVFDSFIKFAVNHLEDQRFVHGHLNPRHISLTPDMNIRLADYSAMVIPEDEHWQDAKQNDNHSIAAITFLLLLAEKFPVICSKSHDFMSDSKSISEYICSVLDKESCRKLGKEINELYEMVTSPSICADGTNKLSELLKKIAALGNIQIPEASINRPVLKDNADNITLHGNFHEGLACAEKNGKFGYVNRNGEVMIPFIYDSASDFEEGLAVIHKNEKAGVIDKTGKEVIPAEYDDISWVADNGLIFTCLSGNWRIANRAGEYISRYVFDDIGDFNHSRAYVRKGRKCGFIDRECKIVIPIEFDDATSFNGNGFARVREGIKQYTINTEGEKV